MQIYEVGEEDGRPFFSLEYVDGGSLAAAVGGPAAAARAAAAAGRGAGPRRPLRPRAGIIHRDLKPANVLLPEPADTEPEQRRSNGHSALPLSDSCCSTPKIADFGLAKYTAAAPGRADSPTGAG